MYARSTTVHGSPQKIDEGIGYVRDQVMPMVEQMDGCIGLSMLADRSSGRCIITTAWESEDALRASAEAVKDSRARAGEVLGSDQPEVAEWELGLMHRVHPADAGACTRVIWAHRGAGAMDDAHDVMRMRILPQVEELPGFCSLSFMVDPTSGRTATAVTYESRAAMDRAAERGSALRTEFSQAAGMEITEVAAFDLVIAHLQVPELV
ncbi:Antibiotic biosynthesis monooxygenase [Modestobacter sp. DSM 44400]|uniref:antibiotic biosynthesis monooxygenase n=1 Tax=Modestobacter sp. DSM 44400 TaxID=1550230 RepID=UPI000896D15C|nr:antibiotic biosynthesis monooxygenase [Modestobacter sp. DSM 44400]SDX75611.1 Antibiotic biosynthesis monooxygenase [Modestobacter sp. DSM 44400]